VFYNSLYIQILYTGKLRGYTGGMVNVKRNLLAKISALLDFFPAVVILGARQVGKTTIYK